MHFSVIQWEKLATIAYYTYYEIHIMMATINPTYPSIHQAHTLDIQHAIVPIMNRMLVIIWVFTSIIVPKAEIPLLQSVMLFLLM